MFLSEDKLKADIQSDKAGFFFFNLNAYTNPI